MSDRNNKGSKLLETLVRKKIIITIIIAIVFMVLSFVIPLIYRGEFQATKYKYIEVACYVSQILSSLFVVLGVVIALLQYVASTYDSKALREREMELREKEIIDLEKDRVQKAIDLSEYYKDNILHNIFIVQSVYKDMKIMDIIDKIKISDMKEFDSHELENLLTTEDINRIENVVDDKNFIPVLIKNSKSYGFAENGFKVVEVVDGDGKTSCSVKCDGILLLREYSQIVNDALNNAEYFAMNFTHNTADESVVYQSLHTTYLQFMKIMYHTIASQNENGREKLYTNAIELFNLWREREEEKRQEALEHTRDCVHHGTKVGNVSKKC